MRIAFDYTAAASHWPGVGRYGRELVRALVRRNDCPELVLFEHGSAPQLPEEALGLDAAPPGRIRRVRLGGSRRLMALGARLGFGGVERRLGSVDLLHRAFPSIPPLRGAASVVPLFELGPPDAAKDAALARELSRAERVVVGSAAGRNEALERLSPHGLAAPCVSAVTTGADHWLRDARPRSVQDNLAAGPPQLLVLGAINDARRPLSVLAGFENLVARLPRKDAPVLHFDGRAGDAAEPFRRALASSPLADRVTWNAEPSEAALPELVAKSTTLVHLSRGELSPITPLEALHFGLSVVASRLAAFEEALEGEVLVSDDLDAAALGMALERGLRAGLDEDARRARRALASRYTWDACAEDHLALWRAVCTGSAGNTGSAGS